MLGWKKHYSVVWLFWGDRPGAVDTSGHDGLDEWTNVLVLHRSLAPKLVVCEPRPVRAEGHGLVLQVTFSTLEDEITVKTLLIQQSDLVADGAVKGVVDQEELHHSLSSFSREVGVGVHLPPLEWK